MELKKLAEFSKLRDAGAITAIDHEFCRFLWEIYPEIEREVLYAACLTSASYQNGNVCIALDDYADRPLFEEISGVMHPQLPELQAWRKVLEQSAVVGSPGDFKPLILDDANRLYLHKLWHYEQNLIHQITQKLENQAGLVDKNLLKNGLDRLFDSTEAIDWQKVAVIAALRNLFTVISGGPGTGKTTTVVRLLALLIEQGMERNSVPSIALAAPTGKAAARLETSIRETKNQLSVDDKVKEAVPVETVTLHQLLGARRHSAKFRYDEENPLPYSCVIVDEVSMVDQALMSRLMNALLPNTRLILLGDKDQLASVEAGSVLGDICGENYMNELSADMAKYLRSFNINLPEDSIMDDPSSLTDHIILLQKSYRFDQESGIGTLAGAVNTGDNRKAIELLERESLADITLQSFDEYAQFEDAVFNQIIHQFKAVKTADTITGKLIKYQTFKILAAHRNGPWGVRYINNRMEQRLQQQGMISAYERWYEGRPIIINANDYSVGLSNGDLGICIMEGNQPKVCFRGDDEIIRLTPSRLPNHSTAYAMTVHKSQGSEFENVMLVLPDRQTKVLSRELLYTAITRARKTVQILGDTKVLAQAIQKKIARNSGLKDHFWK